MPSIPLVRGAAQAIYPVTRSLVFDTGICYNADGTEQRWKRRAPLVRLQLQYSSLPVADVNALVSFFAGQKGEFSTNASITLGSNTYSDLALESDTSEFSETRRGLYDVSLTLRQVKNPSFSIPSVSAVFPTITGGVYTQLPYKPRFRSLTTAGDSPSGPRYTFAWWGASLTGLPTGQLHGWELNYPQLSNTDLGTLETFFTGMQGRLTTFSLTDPENGTVYSNCRFDTDSFTVQHISPNKNALVLPIIETS